MKFDESTPKRIKAAIKAGKIERQQFSRQPIPPAKSYELFGFDELNFGGDRTLIFDVESYLNYFCVSFKCVVTGKIVVFEDSEYSSYTINLLPVTQEQWCQQLIYIIYRFTIVGFNSRVYDLPMCLIAVQGVRAPMLCQITEEIIVHDMPPHEIERKYVGRIPRTNHIDLIEVTPLQGSLKLYAARLHCQRIQDLPFPELSILEFWQIEIVRDYNINDLDNTELLWQDLKQQIDLRVELGKVYSVDLRSRSDAQIAETVIGNELEKLGVKTKAASWKEGEAFYYKVPDFVNFKDPAFQRVLEVVKTTPFVIGPSGYAACPKEIEKLKPNLNGRTYRLGAGGLHSSEENVCHEADEDTLIIDRDVSSYYPYIILNQGLFPNHLGVAFLQVFRNLVNRRINAKREKQTVTADSLKITVNGSFGKLGNPHSKLYSPDLLIQVTMSGQLCLLMLIEAIELAGIPVVSANTDGVVIKCPKNRYADLENVIMTWEEATGFITEETRYKGIYCRDVNNYIAIKESGGCKLKGVYGEVGSALNSPLSKNPEAYIISMALQAFLEEGTPIETTIEMLGMNVNTKYYPTPLSRFLLVRNVRGGGEKDGVYLGKVVRWYYAEGEKGCINSILSGNKVANSDNGKPCMILPDDFPHDIDLARYVREAYDELYKIGVLKKLATGSLL